MPKHRYHKWSGPKRTVHRTERTCLRCGLVKVTRHEPDVLPWVEYERSGIVVRDGNRTPRCEAQR